MTAEDIVREIDMHDAKSQAQRLDRKFAISNSELSAFVFSRLTHEGELVSVDSVTVEASSYDEAKSVYFDSGLLDCSNVGWSNAYYGGLQGAQPL